MKSKWRGAVARNTHADRLSSQAILRDAAISQPGSQGEAATCRQSVRRARRLLTIILLNALFQR